jgi:hypothetical protein
MLNLGASTRQRRKTYPPLKAPTGFLTAGMAPIGVESIALLLVVWKLLRKTLEAGVVCCGRRKLEAREKARVVDIFEL